MRINAKRDAKALNYIRIFCQKKKKLHRYNIGAKETVYQKGESVCLLKIT